MFNIRAKIYLKTVEEDGHSTPWFSGIRPSFNLNGELITCVVIELTGKEWMPLGHEYEVRIDFPYGDEYLDSFKPHEREEIMKNFEPGARFFLHVGAKIIAWGVVL
ncbi:hypothetical protein [Gloeobacter morelensis]|uniref:Uncharacterized protein n=1 Tax=Gloeobacter morelensis MG652769 TaxID=2781736 RepID=A0ABY3PKT3_9CYAN|nr:hypothetical protein [Gloeobacter morelensis]UFP94212.1 hypothetical protein ISF26_21025 [Gloeobacter morelensis MG652769]